MRLGRGYEGRAFAATGATFSILLLVMLVFAARGWRRDWREDSAGCGFFVAHVCLWRL